MLVFDSSISGSGETVCVTGAGGFIASWLVKLLLLTLKGTQDIRGPTRRNQLHVLRTHLLKADLLDYDSLRFAISGCNGVFHTASPVTDDPEKMIEPAVTGTKNVIRAAAEAGVCRVVFTSSIGTVYMDPKRDPDAIVDESYWSDLEYLKLNSNI